MKTTFSLRTLFSFLLLVLLFAGECTAHSYLTNPEPYTRRTCKNKWCPACPRFVAPSEMNNTESRPFATYARGETLNVTWVKNNHGGGFIRFALVPPSLINDYAAHERHAFYYGCWSQGLFWCGTSKSCGADQSGRAFSRLTTIPTVVPDGVYLFAFLWYGGLSGNLREGKFADYESCSFVRIEGGDQVQQEFQPFFEAGHERGNGPAGGKCRTSATSPFECKTGCAGKTPFNAVPDQFQNGALPPKLTSQLYGYDPTTDTSSPPFPSPSPSVSTSSLSSTSPSQSPMASPFVSPSMSASLSAIASASISVSASMTTVASSSVSLSILPSESILPSTFTSPSSSPVLLEFTSVSASVSASVSVTVSASASAVMLGGDPLPSSMPMGSMSASASPGGDPGICKGRICCASSCRRCKSKRCGRRPGGKDNCCPYRIRRNKRKCQHVGAPCKMNKRKQRVYV